jgi:hypothetical protein
LQKEKNIETTKLNKKQTSQRISRNSVEKKRETYLIKTSNYRDSTLISVKNCSSITVLVGWSNFIANGKP